MRIEDVKLPEKVVDILKKDAERLNPPQELAVKSGLLEGKNLVVASPTASGKTLIAELAFLRNFLNSGKSVYLVPLRALASEKYEEFSKKYSGIGMRIAISIGDLDSSEEWLGSYDLIIASNEKMDSLLRHGAKWISRISLVICDEVHVLNDAGRGATLEIVLTRLRAVANAQILALSATIRNAEELAKWLGAKLVRSDFRPIRLFLGICYPCDGKLLVEYFQKASLSEYFQGAKLPEYTKERSSFEYTKGRRPFEYEGKNGFELEMDAELALSEDTAKRGKQALLFVSTRRSSEAAAERIAGRIEKHLSPAEKEKLKTVSKEILSALPSATKQCKRLANSVAKGAAFHHAGLVARQRKLVEDSFRQGAIKILASTPTLAYGLNLPAWRVVIRDVKRFSGFGSDYIPVLEVQQMAGRAGRPQYDTEGEAVIVAKSEKEKDELKEMYIYGEPEPIYSKLSAEPALRMHVLALIASEAVKSKFGLQEFFSRTFFALQYGDIEQVMEKVGKIINELHSCGFIEAEKASFILPDFVPAFSLAKDVKLAATPLGRRVSELYIDPYSANLIIKGMKHAGDLEYIMAINRCLEMLPLLRAKRKEQEFLEEELAKCGLESPDVWDVDYEDFIDIFKTSIILRDWMNESTESRLLDTYGVTPGELYSKLSSAEWLFYAASELALLIEKNDVANRMNKLRLRVKHGVKEELLRLVKLKGIGRVRARLLYKNGIKGAADIKRSPQKVEQILGKGVAGQILEQLDRK